MKPLIWPVILTVGLATTASFATTVNQTERCDFAPNKVSFLVDTSGSMMQTIERKNRIEQIHAFLNKVVGVVPTNHQISTEVTSIAPFAQVMTDHHRDAQLFGKTLSERMPLMETFGRPTILGKRTMDKFATPVQDKTVVILITDGIITTPYDTINNQPTYSFSVALDSFAKANPTSCIHLVSIAQTAQEKEAIANLHSPAICPKVEDLTTLVEDDSRFEAFINNAFYTDCSDAKTNTLTLSSVHFEFDRADLTSEGRSYLHSVLDQIKAKSTQAPIIVQGWTDSTGSENYNQNLSLRRAQTVVKFLVENGCDAKQFKTQGMGESVKFDNTTLQGRAQNRRVEVFWGDNDEI